MRASKTEIVIGVSVLVTAVVVIGGGLWWHDRSKQPRQLSETSSGTNSDSNMSSGQDDSSALSVNGQASELGQLGGNSGNGSNGSVQNSQNGSTGSANSGGIDPSTFSQYDKYKDAKSALFGNIKTGSGAQLSAGHTASIYYKVWLTNGALVDQSPASSSGQPQPFSFMLGAHKVIAGLEEGVYGMKVGGQRLVIVPPALGYGSQGQGAVPPDAVLVFDVQLVSIK